MKQVAYSIRLHIASVVHLSRQIIDIITYFINISLRCNRMKIRDGDTKHNDTQQDTAVREKLLGLLFAPLTSSQSNGNNCDVLYRD